MGTQFSWFYDIGAIAVLLICVYLSGKKGFFKGTVTAVGCILGAVIAVSVSSSVSASLYKTTVRDSNVNKFEKTVIDTDISLNMKNALEGMGYGVIVNTKKLDEIFDSDKDIDEQLYKYMNNINGKVVDEEESFHKNLLECYSTVMKKLISNDVSKYAAETASQKIIDGEADFGILIRQIRDDDSRKKAAQVIADDYVADAYKNVIRLVVFIILFAIIFIVTVLTVKSLTASQRGDEDSTGSHIAGGVCGVITGAVILFAIAVAVRLYVILGSNEMLFFNNEAVDKTYIFKYAYNFLKL